MSNTIMRTYEYRVFPSNKQIVQLSHINQLCANLYNAALAHRIWHHKMYGESVSKYDQFNALAELKDAYPEFKLIHSQILQNVLDKLDKAFKNFFRRIKKGEKPGFPRFKKFKTNQSFCFPQSGFSIIESLHQKKNKMKQKLKLSKIGEIKLAYHRPIEGVMKTCTLKVEPTGKWFVKISVETYQIPLPENEKSVGIDLNLKNFATLSDGRVIENPKFAKKEEKELAKVQRKLSKTEKKSKEREKRKKVVARVHERICNKRDNFGDQESRRIVNEFGVICIEKLTIVRMIEKSDNSKVKKSISEVCWGEFVKNMIYKAENAGRLLIRIDPAYTSQICSSCFRKKEMPLDVRIYRCDNSSCLLVIDRDHNAALNILRLGLQSVHLIERSLGVNAEE